MSVDTSSMFSRVIEDHLALKERNSRLDRTMPIERYKDEDPFGNHALFKSEEQARIEETMDGVDPDFSDESLEDVGLGLWPGHQQAPAAAKATAPATEPVAEEPQAVVEDATEENAVPAEAENAAPADDDNGFWNNSGAREFDWGD